jgi:uncharacterized protein
VYLFGSRARGDAVEDSDYDILVVVRNSDLPAHRRMQIAQRALRGLRGPTDVLVLTQSEFASGLTVVASLPSAGAREGKLVYGV